MQRSPDSLAPSKVVNLDFEARVPVPFSIFPSTYRDGESQTTTQTHEEVDIQLPIKQPAGREGQYSSYSAKVDLPPSGEKRYSEEEVHFTREEERYRRPGFQHEHFVKEEHRPAYSETHVEVDTHRPQYQSPIDIAEREYRERFRSQYHTTVDTPSRPQYQAESVKVNEYTVDGRPCQSTHKEEVKVSQYTVDGQSYRPGCKQEARVCEDTVEPVRFTRSHQKANMGYYDEDGHYHSFRHGMHKLADKIAHPHSHREPEMEGGGSAKYGRSCGGGGGGESGESYLPNTVTIPCNHIRLGDFLMLQGRPCQVIRISTSPATGQYRYLGVDLFTKQLHEESSFISNPAPSVVVQTMMGPVFKQYRVLDMSDGMVVAMTETGDVKQGLPVIDQSNLWSRLNNAFECGRGSVRVLVLNDGGRELAVDMKVIHGSRL
ncbi:hypothetical protein L249_4755 [Ophiocordyceps polyrhachis-furcata BCC 54312]|uniref:Translation initiation factor 5A-like N-terminal domain-containing protein n=1 Tax=Ophiocordyceps polyrhachis-furcata BCC 54312 TaxID=1330021 RepID=A0A367L2C7_9HYPO|nr:hypothetical protein L249_4755 [Ophiocordyceps polyrhachis-furcata BCC 54312]